MSELKIGDRVTVPAFEGVVSHVSFYDPQNIEVAIDGGGEASLPARSAVKVLAVGDVIEGRAAYRALPLGAAVTRSGETMVRTAKGYTFSDGSAYPSDAFISSPGTIVYLPAA